MAFIDEVKSGDHRRALVAMRDVLAVHLAEADPNVAAQVAARLQAVLNDLAAMAKPEGKSASDELRDRREARRSAAKVGESSAVGSLKRGKRSG